MKILDEIISRLERIERSALCSKDVLTLDELCIYTGYSKSYVYRLTSNRQIPFAKKGKELFFSKPEINGWLMGNRVKTQDEIRQEAETFCAVNGSKARSSKRA